MIKFWNSELALNNVLTRNQVINWIMEIAVYVSLCWNNITMKGVIMLYSNEVTVPENQL